MVAENVDKLALVVDKTHQSNDPAVDSQDHEVKEALLEHKLTQFENLGVCVEHPYIDYRKQSKQESLGCQVL